MTRGRRKTNAESGEPDLFGPAEQPDLFGAPQPARYVPKPEYVRNSLAHLLEQLRAVKNWWDIGDWQIERLREDLEYFLKLLPDPAEHGPWRVQHAAEVARLDAASGPSRPRDPNYLKPSEQWLRDYGDKPDDPA